jgi:hypothetical protein
MRRLLHVAACITLCLGVGLGSAQKTRYSTSKGADQLDYPLTVHVTHARVSSLAGVSVLHLDVVIDGTKVELEAGASGLLHTGDYRGRIVTNDDKKSGWFSRSYELLFSDGTHVVFTEVAESE